MDLFWQINWEEMLSALIGTTFVILLPVSIVVVSWMVFPLIDVAFKAKPAPKDTREDARLVDVNYWLKMRNVEGYGNYDPPHERITPLIDRSLVPKRSEGAPTGPVTAPPTPLASNQLQPYSFSSLVPRL